ncbi:hypothetical protein E8D34_16460 [Nocardioides sp. GY 10113]|uniref:hypothetical protein n=1 Tax=Nocardioides sp. GY 10113 TaxID=2569761 RepID=UPI0010A80782|nr:hypothetical protein [Nocardioides sp. GY 10113]TIC83293.1 hypothetical protein E8D34_16460 [Nocardioides sp. GY 10113]
MNHDIEALARRQSGMLARRQLTARGIGWNAVDRQVAAGRWATRTPRVISTFTGELTVDQQRWLGVLHAGPCSLLGGLTAGARHGLVGWERATITVLVDDELAFEPVPGVRFFRSRRPFGLLASPKSGLPSCHLEPALLLWAAYDAPLRPAYGVLAAAVQQGLTTPDRLLEWIRVLKPLRRAPGFRAMMRDIEGGAHSTAERDVLRMCRRYGWPEPQTQNTRTDADGRQRWTDCEWRLGDGTTLVLEVDGSFHMAASQWEADIRRSRRLTAPGRLLIRATAFEVRHEPHEVARDLIALGLVPRAA